MYHPVGAREKDVSTRLIKPTQPIIPIDQVLSLVNNWDPAWEFDGNIIVYDAGIAQYLLVNHESHCKFFAALILGKPSLRCKIINEEPKDVLDEEVDNTFTLESGGEKKVMPAEMKQVEYLKSVLSRRGYRFADENAVGM